MSSLILITCLDSKLCALLQQSSSLLLSRHKEKGVSVACARMIDHQSVEIRAYEILGPLRFLCSSKILGGVLE